MSAIARSILIVEPRVEGFHVAWLRFITSDFLASGYRVCLALDTRPAPYQRVKERMDDLLQRVSVVSLNDHGFGGSRKARAIAGCLAGAQAQLAFLIDFSEIGSNLLRQAAFGLLPPPPLKGRLGGVYFRPSFASRTDRSVQGWLKRRGAARLLHHHWISHWLFIDRFLLEDAQARFPASPIFPLADPYPEDFHADREASRGKLQLPPAARVFLFYGGSYRRKGLHLAVKAWLQMPGEAGPFLLCAGQQADDPEVAAGLAALARQGRARVINRYVSAAEERELFAACDFVLLPYHGHRDSSGVLALAAGASRPVVASDEYLIGHTVRQHGMGLLFPPGEVNALRAAVQQAERPSPGEMARWQAGARACGATCTRAVFRQQLLAATEDAFERAPIEP